MLLFQTQIEEHKKLAEHYRDLAAQREAKAAELAALEQEVMGAVQTIKGIQAQLDPSAAATLQSQILSLLGNGGGDGGGGNQPTDPIPDTDPDEPELLCLNGETGDCLTTDDLTEVESQETAQTEDDGDSEDESATSTEAQPFAELVKVSDAIAYQRKHDGEILCSYVGFNKKSVAKSWMRFLEPMVPERTELREAKRLQDFKWELKIKGLSIQQIERLSLEDLSKPHCPEIGSSKPPTYRPHTAPQPTAQKSQLSAKILLKESEYVGQILPVSRVSPNEMGYTVTLPDGQNRWFKADLVQILDAEIEKNALPAEPETLEFNDLVEVIADKNDAVGLVGAVGRINSIGDHWVGVEIDGQLAYFRRNELKVKAKKPMQLSLLESSQPANGVPELALCGADDASDF